MREFSKEIKIMAKKYLKECLWSLAVREMQMKTTSRIYLTPVRMAEI